MVAVYHLIVGFHAGTSSAARMRQHRRNGTRLVRRIPEIHAHVVSVRSDKLRTCLSAYKACKHVRYVEREHYFSIKPMPPARGKRPRPPVRKLRPNDPLLYRQWGLSKIAAERAWPMARRFPPKVRIAILDTGIDSRHPDLKGKIILSKNFSASPTSEDLHGHGTHVAGIAAAITNNRIGVAGMSYNAASLMNVKVLDDSGRGAISDIARGILYAVRHKASVINMSLGYYRNAQSVRDAVRLACRKRILVVAAAGNDNTSEPSYPAAIAQVFAVAATDRNDKKSYFSNYGSWVDVAAPGSQIWSTSPIGNGYAAASGTSQASPFVSGLAALIKATRPQLGQSRIRAAIEAGSDRIPGTGTLFRYGRINAAKAIRLARRCACPQRKPVRRLA